MKAWQALFSRSANRRELVRGLGLLATMPLVPGCNIIKEEAAPKVQAQTSPPTIVKTSDESYANTELITWVRSVSPIQPATIGLRDFTGDAPASAHAALRDAKATAKDGAPDETARVVVIGGGMAGLATAYLLRDLKPLVLEHAPKFGGNAKGETWNGITYSIGAAYCVKLGDEDPIVPNFYKPLGLDKDWRLSKDGAVAFQSKLVDGFWDGSTVPDDASKAQVRRIRDYLKTVAAESYPTIPPEGDVPASLVALDRRSLTSVLEEANGGPLQPHVRAMIEHYCWSSFGGTMSEISAAAGLNFLAGEEEGICAFPGGNSHVTEKLLKTLLNDGVPRTNLRPSTTVTLVTPTADGVRIQCQKPDGTPHVIEAKAAVIACPKFIAKRIVAGLPDEQTKAMSQLAYRSYLVANVLIDEPVAHDQYDIYMLGDPAETFADTQAAAEKQRATDVIIGHWAGGGHRSASVLTLYRGFPYDGMRAVLQAPEAFAKYRSEFVAQLPEVLQTLGVKGTVPDERVLMSRWGHPLVLSATGLIADGVVTKAHATLSGKVFFCNQDDWALPAIETCLARAIKVAAGVRGVLG